MLKKRIVTFLLSLLFAIVLTTGALASFNVFAEESYTGYFIGSSVPNGKDIKELANTYDLNGNLINDAVVSSSAPQLTILTHGYGSDASVWSNPIEFFDSTRKQNRYGIKFKRNKRALGIFRRPFNIKYLAGGRLLSLPFIEKD